MDKYHCNLCEITSAALALAFWHGKGSRGREDSDQGVALMQTYRVQRALP